MMKKFFKPLFLIVTSSLLILLSGCNSKGTSSPESHVKLERIDIVASPITTRGVSELTLAKGNKQPFEAIGHYSDGSSRTLSDLNVSNWHTSNSDAGRFDEPGVFIATNEGHTTVTATKDGVTSNSVDVNVSSAVITSIQIGHSVVYFPQKGLTQELKATAIYSDETSTDVSDSVAWATADTATATVSPTGVLTAVDMGRTTLTASKDGEISNTVDVSVSAEVITSIQVKPSKVDVPKGLTQKLGATATFSDGTPFDISNLVTWKTADTNTATVSSTGVLTAVDMGRTTLTASKDGVTSDPVDVDVSSAVMTSIQVDRSAVNFPQKGLTKVMKAKAIFSDGGSFDVSDSVIWATADTATAIVSSMGVLTSVEMGRTILTASKDGVTSDQVDVTVSAEALTSIQVTPSQVRVLSGRPKQLTATATFSDGTSFDTSNSVTWRTADTDTANVSSTGVLTAVKAGNTTVTASKDGVTNDQQVDVISCISLADPCIDLFDTGSGKLFTSSPSSVYLDSIGSVGHHSGFPEGGTDGPIGYFSLFKPNLANELCTTYNNKRLGGRTNWSLATKDELKEELHGEYGPMFVARGWPTAISFWSATPSGSGYYRVDLRDGQAGSGTDLESWGYASCVSNP